MDLFRGNLPSVRFSLSSRFQVKAQVFDCLLAEERVVVMVLAFRYLRFDVDVDRYDALLEVLPDVAIPQAHQGALL